MAGTRQIRYRLMIDWDFNGTFTDESAYLESARGDMRLTPPAEAITGGSGIVSSMSLTMRNPSGRFSPLRTDGALYAYLANGGGYHVPCYLEVSIDGGTNYYRVFTGVLKLPQESTLTSRENPLITIEARSREETLLQRRESSTVTAFQQWHETGAYETNYIYSWLSDYGISGGDIDLDPPMFRVPYAWLDDESPIEEAWNIAAACGGRLYADPDGNFIYENLAHWETATRSTVSQATFTRDSMAGLSIRYDDTEIYNVVTVEAAPRIEGGAEIVWESDAQIAIEPGVTTPFVARYDTPVYTITGYDYEARTAGGWTATTDVSATVTYYAQRAEFEFTNSGTEKAYLTSFRILGVPIIGGPEQEQTRNSTDHGVNAAWFADRGTRTKSIRGNPYIQTPAHAGTLAQFMLRRLERPRVTMLLSQCPGVSALRLSDRITVTDANTLSSSTAAIVTGIAWSLSLRGGFTQDIEAIQVAHLYPNTGNYFVVGTHALGSSRKVFF